MRSLWTGLLFLHGHIADVDLARRLAEEPTIKPKAPRAKALAVRVSRPFAAGRRGRRGMIAGA